MKQLKEKKMKQPKLSKLGTAIVKIGTRDIISALQSEQKDKQESAGFIDQLIDLNNQEINILGQQLRDRETRQMFIIEEMRKENDAQASIIAQRNDVLVLLREKLNGYRAEQFILSGNNEEEEPPVKFEDFEEHDKQPLRGEPGKRKRGWFS